MMLINSRFRLFPSILLLVMGLLHSGVVVKAQGALPCERATIALSVSPDNAWVALVQEGACFAGAITVSTNTVRLARRDSIGAISLAAHSEKADSEDDILVIDYYGHPENRPLVHWLSPSKLQITIPNISGVGLQKSSYQGVDIVIKYEPDDPAAREKWLKERGLLIK